MGASALEFRFQSCVLYANMWGFKPEERRKPSQNLDISFSVVGLN